MMQVEKIPKKIAIDGPAASGKSSVGKRVAEKLDYIFLDTGIMYRAVTYAVLHAGIDVNDEDAVGHLAESIKIEIEKSPTQSGRNYTIFIDKKDVTQYLRTHEVNTYVSIVSRYRRVRNAMTEQQRMIGGEGAIVMAGRDIGTVVLPDADLKIYLEATPQERARRRHQEERVKGIIVPYEDILKNVKMRDEIDSTREIAPLKPARDAYIINTDGKDILQVTQEILEIIGV